MVWGLVLFGCLVYLSLIWNQNVWLDEAFTASLIRTDMAGVLQRSMEDTLPPLYNILLKLFTGVFGYTIQVMKITSIIPMALSMVLGATAVRKRFGTVVSALFITALFAMPQMLFYGVEIRMYSWGFFFALASAVFAWEVIQESSRRNWVLFTFLSVGAGYTHHFAFVTVGFIYLFLLLYYILADRPHIRRWFWCLLATAVLYLPCLLITLRQLKSVSGYFSMPEVTFGVFIKYARYPYTVGFTPLSVLLLLTAAALLAYGLLVRKKDGVCWYGLACVVTYYGVLLFGTAASKVMTANIFVDRYLFFAMGILWLGFAALAGSLDKKVLAGLFVLFLSVGIVGYVNQFTAEYSQTPETVMRHVAQREETLGGAQDFVVCEEESSLLWCFTFYYPERQVTAADELLKQKEPMKGIWCVVPADGEAELAALCESGYETIYEGSYGFDRYTFALYYLQGAEYVYGMSGEGID